MKKLSLLFLLIIFISCASSKKDPIPTHNSFSFFSNKLKESRIINVWTPPEYNKERDSFPVLYMPDGGIKEDFPHMANTLSKLIKEKKIPPFILVGIENTERGRDLTGFSQVKADEQYCPLTDGAKNFRFFIKEELFDEIDQRYRTTTKKGIIGESLAGLFVMETFLKTPSIFDFYIAFDPSLWWDNHFLVRNSQSFLKKNKDNKAVLWYAGSSAEDIQVYTRELSSILNKHYPKVHWKYVDEPDEKHHTIFRADKEKALVWALNIK